MLSRYLTRYHLTSHAIMPTNLTLAPVSMSKEPCAKGIAVVPYLRERGQRGKREKEAKEASETTQRLPRYALSTLLQREPVGQRTESGAPRSDFQTKKSAAVHTDICLGCSKSTVCRVFLDCRAARKNSQNPQFFRKFRTNEEALVVGHGDWHQSWGMLMTAHDWHYINKYHDYINKYHEHKYHDIYLFMFLCIS